LIRVKVEQVMDLLLTLPLNHLLVPHPVLHLLLPRAHPDHQVRPALLVEEDPDMEVCHRADFLHMVLAHLRLIRDLAVEVVAEVVVGLLMARRRLQVLKVPPVLKASGSQHLYTRSKQPAA
jgi:hypothetical protein